ncbi:putative protein kinase [Babesia divergens]|uniref:SCY1-like protein 2 n=1 Tax=Babesia divergens TaxID=32595 RepID=A0AAD9LGZ0_BABDI|nr:putative protein kinase [Babesia divergens]
MLKYFTGKTPISSSSTLGFKEGEPVETPFGHIQSYKWYNGSSKAGDSQVSIFKFTTKNHDNPDQEFADRHLQCIKLLVHPNILKVLKVKQSEKSITIATEHCQPLTALSVSFDPALGFWQVFTAIHFLHTKCNKTYGLISPMGVVVRDDGSWCLSSFECAVDNEMSIHRVLADLKMHASWRDGWRPTMPSNASVSVRQVDQWGLGALICWVYTLIAGHVELCHLRRQDCDIHALKRYVPANLHGLIDQLMSPNHDVDLEETLKSHPYFCSNVSVVSMSFVLEFHIKTEEQISEFFTNLPSRLPRIPIEIACKQLLPEILKAMSIHKALVPKILESVVIICKSILVDEFRAKVYPHISRLFKENDRSIRYCLLKLMPHLDPLLDTREVSEDMFEPMLIGFNDSSSQIRDETVKTMAYVIKKIKRRQQHNAVMLLFKCVEDVEPTIRVNSIICFAKIIPFIQPDLVVKVIPQVWQLGLHDPFVKSRLATLDSISASHGFFSAEQKVEILLPLACTKLLDAEQPVRKQALEAIYTILESLKGHIMAGDKASTDRHWAERAQTSPSPTTGPSSPRQMAPQASNIQQDWNEAAVSGRIADTTTAPTRSHTQRQPSPKQTDTMQNDPMHELEDFFDPFPAKK